jgi:hypothetical protein
MSTGARASAQARVDGEMWSSASLLDDSPGRTLRAAEVLILVRHRDALGGRVLELGCIGGRLRPSQRSEPDYPTPNDAQEFAILHCFERIECLDLDGREVRRGEEAAATPELHYVARKR